MAYRSGSDYRRKEEWHGLPGSHSRTKGSLTSLTLIGASLSSQEELQSWSIRTNFACLQHLDLGLSYDYDSCELSGETMKWLAQYHTFPQLRTLQVSLDRNHTYQDRPHYSENAVFFFQTLESLEQLSIHGSIDSKIVSASCLVTKRHYRSSLYALLSRCILMVLAVTLKKPPWSSPRSIWSRFKHSVRY